MPRGLWSRIKPDGRIERWQGVKDGLNQPVPDWLAKVFKDGRLWMHVWVAHLDRRRRALGRMAGEEYAADLDFAAAYECLDRVRELVFDATPFARCDCAASEKECPRCKGKRWLSLGAYRAATREKCPSGLPVFSDGRGALLFGSHDVKPRSVKRRSKSDATPTLSERLAKWLNASPSVRRGKGCESPDASSPSAGGPADGSDGSGP